MEEEAILNDDRLRLRHAHEETIAREYAFQKGVKLRRVNQTLHHKRLPFMICHLDRVIIGQRKLVECKSSSGFMRPTWGENGSDQAPMHYILQVQHQLAVSEYEHGDIAALIDIDDYRLYPMPRNDAIIKKIEEACEKFWHEHVLADIPPPPSTRGDLKLMFPTNNGNFIAPDEETEMNLMFLKNKKDDISTLTKEKEALERQIIYFIGDNDGLKTGDNILATYQANKNGVRTLRIKGA